MYYICYGMKSGWHTTRWNRVFLFTICATCCIVLVFLFQVDIKLSSQQKRDLLDLSLHDDFMEQSRQYSHLSKRKGECRFRPEGYTHSGPGLGANHFPPSKCRSQAVKTPAPHFRTRRRRARVLNQDTPQVYEIPSESATEARSGWYAVCNISFARSDRRRGETRRRKIATSVDRAALRTQATDPTGP